MGDKKWDGGRKKMSLSDTSDPLGLRSVRLGGDAPSLHSESAFVRKQNSRNGNAGGESSPDARTGGDSQATL